MGIICSLKNLSLSFGSKIIFKQANAQINLGDKIGLIGPNGKGKSSLFNVLLGKVSADKTVPAFIFDKASSSQGEKISYSVFLIPQEFEFNKNNVPSIKDYFFEHYPHLHQKFKDLDEVNLKLESSNDQALIEKQNKLLDEIDHLNGWELLNKYQSYLKYFNLNNHNVLVDSLSGGEQKKILLSLGLTTPANLVLWDEPTNHLDIETIKLFEEELLAQEKTYVMISHDRFLLSRVTNKILYINNGEINEFKGDYTNYLKFLVEQENSRLVQLERLENSLRRETAWMRQGVKARRTRSKKRVEDFNSLSKDVQQLKDQAKKSVNLDLYASKKKTKKLIEFENTSLKFEEKEIFKSLNNSIYKGQRIGLIGANGSGKTSLVKLITSQLAPSLGKIKQAEDIKINYFSQKREELDPNTTPFELLGDGKDRVLFEDGRSQHVIGYFQNFLFNKDEINRPLSTFSGGELARLQLAQQLMNFGDLWIFDEPTNDLDIETIEILEDKLAKFQGSVLLISHDRTFLENVTDTVWLIEDKGIQVFEGGYSQAAPYIEALYLENELKNQANDNNEDKEDTDLPSPAPVITQKKSFSAKEIKDLEQKISKKEKLIEDLEKLMNQFDFSTNDPEKAKLYKQLQSKKDITEEELLSLYEEHSEMI